MVNFSKLKTFTSLELETLCQGAKVLEQDAYGRKVLLLADGCILKLFRVKRWWSSARLVPYSRRFCRNANKLARLGIPTVQVKSEFRLETPGLTAVVYKPLPGTTLRQYASNNELDAKLGRELGMFVAKLHEQGVFFRSLHLGNIVVMPDGRMGLIDIADMSIWPWPLSCRQRLRNFRHLCRLAEDRRLFRMVGWQAISDVYLEASRLFFGCKRHFAMHIPRIFLSD